MTDERIIEIAEQYGLRGEALVAFVRACIEENEVRKQGDGKKLTLSVPTDAQVYVETLQGGMRVTVRDREQAAGCVVATGTSGYGPLRIGSALLCGGGGAGGAGIVCGGAGGGEVKT